VFVEIENGVEGLVHISEMSWLKNNPSPAKLLRIGQELNVMILDISTEHHRISLGIKQCTTNPWKVFADNNKTGDILEGTVKNTTDFGLFVEFDGDIDGLVHISDLDWDDPEGKIAIQKYKKNDKIKVVLLGCDYEQERISLGIKQVSNANFKEDLDNIQTNKKVNCVVKNIRRDFLEVELDIGLKGIIKKTDISSDKKEQRTDRFTIGDKLEATVFLYEKDTGKLVLVLKNLEEVVKDNRGKSEDEDFDISQYMATDNNTTLGSVFGNIFNNINE
jgi:small subunit ribosomal protein S1